MVEITGFNPCCHGSALQPEVLPPAPLAPSPGWVSILVVMDQLFSLEEYNVPPDAVFVMTVSILVVMDQLFSLLRMRNDDRVRL